MTDLTRHLDAIELATWNLAHKKIELATAGAYLASLAETYRQFEENYRQHQTESSNYIASLTRNLAEARTRLETLAQQLDEMRAEKAKTAGVLPARPTHKQTTHPKP